MSVDKMSVKGDWNEDPAPALLVIVDIRHQNAITQRAEDRGQKGGCGPAAVIGQKISPSSLHKAPGLVFLVCLVNSLWEHSGMSLIQ